MARFRKCRRRQCTASRPRTAKAAVAEYVKETTGRQPLGCLLVLAQMNIRLKSERGACLAGSSGVSLVVPDRMRKPTPSAKPAKLLLASLAAAFAIAPTLLAVGQTVSASDSGVISIPLLAPAAMPAQDARLAAES